MLIFLFLFLKILLFHFFLCYPCCFFPTQVLVKYLTNNDVFLFCFLFADIWCSNNEQCVMSIGLLGAGIREGINMGLLFRSFGYSHRLHCHGCLCQFPHSFPSMDIYNGYPTLSFLPGIGLCS